MAADEKILEIISNETKNTISEMVVVTPSIYTSVFSKFAAEHNADITKEESISDNLLSDKIAIFTDIQNQTSNNVQILSENTDKAISAIKRKDEKTLTEVLHETQKLREEIKNLKKSMYKDELTHVYNRRWLHDTILDKDAHSFIGSGTLAMIDLDYFKEINDTYGHTIGDKVLIFIAGQLRSTRENVVRYGGDEFIVIFRDGVTQNSALSTLNTIRENILTKYLKVKDASFKVSFSLGAQEFKEGDHLNDIIEIADKNMYDDKLDIKKRVTGIN